MSLYLSAAGLFSKWGFSDGDCPEHVLDYLDDNDPPAYEALCSLDRRYDDVWHDVLRTLVRGLLLPMLPVEVTTYDIGTIHNPIRAESVAGVPVDWDEGSAVMPFTDVAVEVPMHQVHAVVCEHILAAEARS